MSSQDIARARFEKYAWWLLAYNVVVILSGAFVRATVSGDGCGNHWPNCNGQIIPSFYEHKEVIEFSHRMLTGVLLPMVIALAVWARRLFPKGHQVRGAAYGVLAFTLVEALIGAVLVKWGLVAHDQSMERVIVMPLHLIATFGLLFCGTLAAWWAGSGEKLRLRGQGPMLWAMALGLLATLLLGISGAITALGDTLFPGEQPAGTHFLVDLRIYHPLIALSAGLYVTLMVGLTMRLRPSPAVEQFGRWVLAIFGVQMIAGLVNRFLYAPVSMQLIHLLLADMFWISLVLLNAAALSEKVPQIEFSQLGLAGADRAPRWKDYLALTKPRVISLLLFTTVTAMFIAAGTEQRPSVWLSLAVAIGFYMAAGAANTINMVLERDLDVRMDRTATRPTVTQVVPAPSALAFALVLMIGSFGILWWAANLLAAMLALAGLVFYVVIYTLLLKRRTWTNIVIGGAAGAFPPLVGWAAVANELSPLAWCLFTIIFLWTPVHFWALALMIKDDYARAGVPMLPVVRGERATVVQIAYYTVLTVAVSVLPMILPGSDGQSVVGWFYLGTAAVLNAVLVLRSIQLYRCPDRPQAVSLFKYSMVYLALLFLAMAVDRAQWS